MQLFIFFPYNSHFFCIFFKISVFPFQSMTSLRTSLICLTGIILIFFSVSGLRTTSFMLDFGTMTFFMPASMAASIFAETPPIGSTSPLTDNEPVMAYSCLIGTFFKAEIIAVATAIEAESPSTPS